MAEAPPRAQAQPSTAAKLRKPEGVKEKGGHEDRLFQTNSGMPGNYMPEPWMLFQLASIAFTALSGSGT